jgi:hypothetical protein
MESEDWEGSADVSVVTVSAEAAAQAYVKTPKMIADLKNI